MSQRLDQRLSSLDIQLSSQVRYVSFDNVGMMLPIEIVQMFQQLLLRNNRARPMNEIFKNSVLRWREIERPAPAAHRLLHGVQFQIRNHEHWSRDTSCARSEE